MVAWKPSSSFIAPATDGDRIGWTLLISVRKTGSGVLPCCEGLPVFPSPGGSGRNSRFIPARPFFPGVVTVCVRNRFRFEQPDDVQRDDGTTSPTASGLGHARYRNSRDVPLGSRTVFFRGRIYRSDAGRPQNSTNVIFGCVSVCRAMRWPDSAGNWLPAGSVGSPSHVAIARSPARCLVSLDVLDQ